MAVETIKSGASTLTLDQQKLIGLLNRTSNGALDSFRQGATASLTRIRAGAQAGWPVGLRQSTTRSRDAFQITEGFVKDGYRVTLANTAAYAFYVRFSQYTAAEIEAEATRLAGGPDHFDGERKFTAIALARALSRRPTPTEFSEQRRAYWLRYLRRVHGRGASSEAVRGKHAWTLLVRGPQKAETEALMAEIRADLSRLAGGAP